METFSAKRILQEYLDVVATAVLAGDLESYAERVGLPLLLVTRSARLHVTTLEELADGFDTYTDMLADLGATALQRLVLDADFETPDRIEGHYRTRTLRGDADVLAPFLSLIILERIDGVWKATAIRNTTNASRWPVFLTGTSSAQE
jgi:hypothetical protein